MPYPKYSKGEQVTYTKYVWEFEPRRGHYPERPLGIVYRTSDMYDGYVEVAWPDVVQTIHKDHLVRYAFKDLG